MADIFALEIKNPIDNNNKKGKKNAKEKCFTKIESPKGK